MKIDGKETAAKVRGWMGFALGVLPFLQFVPVPAVQAVMIPLHDFLFAFVGAGAILQATSPAIIKKSE
ncbi:hypothetical protein UFOVP1365_29 [uncultured Caudovirales phage]|uniref:Uncharacterized protein n=1 Tax=uncultured Caudovirales phage TaxID=2100421 RepID=A0A6J5S460_9CAUD|nr:hypothetical protein UFOVP1365_29 [uncultured Caudovirales phage]